MTCGLCGEFDSAVETEYFKMAVKEEKWPFCEAMRLNELIFGFHERYCDLNEWERKIGSSGIVFIIENCAFLASYEREREGTEKSTHIWLCGVVPHERGKYDSSKKNKKHYIYKKKNH